jgi:tryptophan 2,3-dioxygenase
MNREAMYAVIQGAGTTDYELYLNTPALLACQKDYRNLCNRDELQFQIVHQVEELWMKLIGYTLLDLDECIQAQHTNRVITLFRRVHRIQELMNMQFSLLETMSPKDYQSIRATLGNGSGQESPGFRSLMRMSRQLWQSFQTHYLDAHGLTVEKIYDSEYSHGDAYMVAEALAEYDSLFRQFRFHHIQLIRRSIGLGARSLKGRPVEMLEAGIRYQFFPELWAIRDQMTDNWGANYGYVRDSLSRQNGHAAA